MLFPTVLHICCQNHENPLCTRVYPLYTPLSFLPQTPVIALVGNDACWSQISREQVPILGSNVACGLAFTGKIYLKITLYCCNLVVPLYSVIFSAFNVGIL